ncbi:MAG TPA: glucose-6-phosphate isomerase [Candidatus Limnocylindrales bacterium]|nr:glucose-6-phosphate isomerase [Candidatus Limnocylindrales bacterium]
MIGRGGIASSDLELVIPRLATVLEGLEVRRRSGELAFYDLPYDEQAIAQCRSLAGDLIAEFDDLLVLGIGGSALGTKAVLDAIAPARRARGLRVHVADNVDPDSFATLLASLNPERTAVDVISKSGGTAETLAQLLIVRQWLIAAVGERAWQRHVVITTDPERGPLRALADSEALRSLPVPPGVGGRFSVLTAVGLLPIAAAGIDIQALCEGAQHADTFCSQQDPWHNPAALHAGLLFLALRERGCNIHVLMPYNDSLLRLAEWYAQLWAESLGKARALDGAVVEVGQTPVRALGATDQHSQVQLYVEGPRDKVVTFVRVVQPHQDVPIPASPYGLEELDYLSGHTLGELLNMEQRATELALAEAGRMTSLIELERVDEAALGYLLYMFEVQTLVAGALLNIDPLDQPGVEAGKRLTFAMAGRQGYAADAERVRAMLQRKKDELVLG